MKKPGDTRIVRLAPQKLSFASSYATYIRSFAGRHVALTIVIALIVGLIVFIGAWTYVSGVVEARQMTIYLEKKYDKEFKVGRPKKKAYSFGVEGYLEAKAHPLDNKELSFPVWSSSAGRSDDYPGAVWQYQESKRLAPLIRRYFGQRVTYDIRISTTSTIRGKDVNIHGNIPPFSMAASVYGHQILYDLDIHRNMSITSDDKRGISNAIYNFLKNISLEADVILTYETNVNSNQQYGVSLDDSAIVKLKIAGDIEQQFKVWRIQ